MSVDNRAVYLPGKGDSPTVTAPDPSGCRPGDTEAGCKNPSAQPWCPVTDSTRPICDETGAFQNDIPDDYNTAKPRMRAS